MSADAVRKVRLSNKLCPNFGLMTLFPTITPYCINRLVSSAKVTLLRFEADGRSFT